jgi:hypothetical protein
MNCSSSFLAGTEVLTPDGLVNIEDIEVGDWVISDDPETEGGVVAKQVTRTFERTDNNGIVEIILDDELISTTGNHEFWLDEKGWVEANDIEEGDLLWTEDGDWLAVEGISKREGTFEVFNFEVDDFHTYFVSQDGVLVHNVNCKISPKTGNPILAEVEYISPGNAIIEASKPSRQGKLGISQRYENPGHHDPNLSSLGRGQDKFNPNKSVLPDNHIELFNQSITYKRQDGAIYRYARDKSGNIHRFQPSSEGINDFHWNGSTNGMAKNGLPRKIKLNDIPSEIRKIFGV